MVKVFPFIFILLWSSAFITTKPIIDNSDPFSALAFRFALVALGFFLFSIYSKKKIIIDRKNFFESFFSGVLFHGVYLGGVFFSISKGMPTGIAALIVTLQPILTNALSGPILNEKFL
jgi:EamA-like transporter family.